MKRGVYASAHRIIISSLVCNCFRDLGSYGFPEFVKSFMIPFDVVGVFSISTSLQTVPL